MPACMRGEPSWRMDMGDGGEGGVCVLSAFGAGTRGCGDAAKVVDGRRRAWGSLAEGSLSARAPVWELGHGVSPASPPS